MSTRVSKTIIVAELTTLDDQRIVFPLAFPESTWLANKGNDMLRHLQAALQKEVLNEGLLLDAIRMTMPENFTERDVEMSTPAGKNTYAIRESFHVFTAELAGGRCHSFIPALGIEIISENVETLDDDVREHVRLEHVRSGRFADLRKLIASQWYKEARLRHFSIDVDVLGPDEQAKQQVKRLLPDVAVHMSTAGPEVAGLDEAVAELTRRIEGKFSRSALVIGAESSGKTSLVHAYAKQRKQRGLSPIWETSSVRLSQALTREGRWQKNLAVLCNELFDEEIVLYVGHLTELFEVGQYSGNNISIGAALRDQLQRGRILLLAEGTDAELAKLELINAGFAVLFQEVRMPRWDEPQQQMVVTEAIGFRSREHGVSVAAAAVEEAILLQRRYSPYSGFPGKPIRFIESLILQQKLHGQSVQREHIMKAFCAETGIPQTLLDAQLELDTQAMQDFFRKRIFGQMAAIDLVCDTLLSIKATMTRAGKPIASLLLIGPTGVGKTETAKALAEYMFGDADRMLRFDMSEYSDATSVLRLTGDLGTDEGTLVTRIRQQPFSVVLFDEVEKAHYSFFDLLLQILGEGRLTGGKGQLANFCSAVIIMTSNIGAAEMQRHPMGMHPDSNKSADVVRHFEHAVQNHFRPELFNRLDHIVPFAPLNDAQRRPIIERELGMVKAREGIRQRAMSLELDQSVIAHLCAGVHDDRYGARQMQRVMQDQLVFPLVRLLGGIPYSRPIRVSVNGGADGLEIVCGPGTAVVRSASFGVADEVADQRRQLQKIQAGPVWTELLNKRYMLNMKRLKMQREGVAENEQRFWDLYGEAYNALNAVLKSGEELLAAVLAGEGQMLLAQMADSTDKLPADAVNFDRVAWDRHYLRFKATALGLSRPEANCCTVGIYGAAEVIEPLRDLYLEIAKLASFAISANVVKVERDICQKQPWPIPPNAKPFDAPLVGYEIECKGASAYYLFAAEAGVWRAGEEEKKHVDLFVSVSQKTLLKHATPVAVYRKSFYEGRPKVGFIKHGSIGDAKDVWRCPYPNAEALHAQMKISWSRAADNILLGEDLT